MSIKKDILWRVAAVYIFTAILGLIILGKAAYIQFAEGEKWKSRAQNITLKDITIKSNRGNIYAEDMRLLASSIPYYEIRMDLITPSLTDDIFYSKIDSLALSLSRLFNDRSQAQYKRQLVKARKDGERYYLVKKNVNYLEMKEVREFPIFRRGQYKGGLIVRQYNKRFQPHINLASRTIGYTTLSERGNIVGIEGAYDHYLKGINGITLMQRATGGVWVPLNDGTTIDPKDGKDIVTTIDVNYQDVAESALLKQLLKHEAHHGTAVLMEVSTGDIKAIANLERDNKGNYREIYNYAIGESIEPGSTFKLASLLVALEDGVVDLDDTIDTEDGKIRFFDKVIEDTEPEGYGKITVKRVFEVSSNVGVAKIVSDNYRGRENRFIDRLYAMHLNERLGIEIKGEGKPEIKYPDDNLWSGISLPMMAHGYEVRLTPLQILAFYNAIANGGKLVKPRFVKEVSYHGQTIEEFDVEVINPSIVSQSTLVKARKMLEGVVESGTASNLKTSNYKIAGKTGTAQIANEKFGYRTNSKVSYSASFVGYFPADDPKYSCIVVINGPSKSVYYGNLVAGPVFKTIADKVYATNLSLNKTLVKVEEQPVIDAPYTKIGDKNELNKVLAHLNIPVKASDEVDKHSYVITSKHDKHIAYKPYRLNRSLVPNVKEMGLKDAVYLLEEMGFDVQVRGRGKVVSQSLQAGTRFQKGQRIVLEMSFL